MDYFPFARFPHFPNLEHDPPVAGRLLQSLPEQRHHLIEATVIMRKPSDFGLLCVAGSPILVACRFLSIKPTKQRDRQKKEKESKRKSLECIESPSVHQAVSVYCFVVA